MKRRAQPHTRRRSVPVIVTAASVAAMLGTDVEALSDIAGFPPTIEDNGMSGYDMTAFAVWHEAQRMRLIGNARVTKPVRVG